MEISEQLKVSINIVLAALTTIGTLILVKVSHPTNKLAAIWGMVVVVWGFLLFAAWQNFLLPHTADQFITWVVSWTLPMAIAIIVTLGAIYELK